MGIRLTRIRIENFKSIKEAEFPVSFSNLFLGKNNSGKSSILKAINLAISKDASINKNDVCDVPSSPYNVNKKVTIELLFEPEDRESNSFDLDWSKVFENAIGKLGNTNREIFGIRRVFSYNKLKRKYEFCTYFISKYIIGGMSVVGGKMPDYILDTYLTSYYIDATIDQDKNIESHRSFIDKILTKIKALKNVDLHRFSDDVVKEIKSFDPDFAYKSIFETMSNVSGGTNSVMIYSLYKAQINLFYKLLKPFHSILLIEEPETHMHPQAQMELMNIVKGIEGQHYICTHSPYVVNHFPVHKLVRVVHEDEKTLIYKFDTRVNINELRAINLKCMTYKAEMVFANKVILFEGQTEHIALPIYFKKYFDCYPFEKGYSFVYVEGDSNYKAYLQICNALKIDWYIFSDGEPVVIDFLNKMMRGLTHNPDYQVNKDKRISLIPDGLCYEEYLAYHGYAQDVSNVIDYKEKRNNVILDKVNSNGWEIFKKESKKYRPDYPDFEQCVAVTSKKHKIDYAESVAKEICSKHEKDDLPKPVLDLFKLIEEN